MPLGNRLFEARLLRSSLQPSEVRLDEEMSHLLILVAGRVQLDGVQDHDLAADSPRLLWLPPGSAPCLKLSAGARGALLRLGPVTLARALPTGTMHTRLRGLLGQLRLLPLAPEARDEMLRHMEAIAEESRSPRGGTEVIVESLVSVLLVQLWRAAEAGGHTSGLAPRSLLDRFVLLVARHGREHWSVSDYAAALDISRDRLGTLVRQATGLSPQGYLHREVLADARDLLINSTLQISEVAFRLGFQDPAYFNRFFTRQEGLSPGRFRRAARARQREGTTNFAAWP
ncbi:MAG: helix-turn-helix domain-containing protein [Rhodobacteraceae bacterium]|nr:helix-turn-helix domain-containing protein [Paracoccaceae bacterium]MBR9823888.1 helix-turn-helix domain-containing protein [Paracoccaceae bacterium]